MARRLMYGWVINSAPSVVTAPFIDLSGPKAEVSAALDRVMSEDRPAGRKPFPASGRTGAGGDLQVCHLPADLVGWLDGRSSLARTG